MLQAQTCLAAPHARTLSSSQSPHGAIPREQSPEQSHLLVGLRDTSCWESGETETPLRHRAGPSRSQASVRWEGAGIPRQVPGTSPKRLYKGSSVQQLPEEGLRCSSLPGEGVGSCCERRGQSSPQGLPRGSPAPLTGNHLSSLSTASTRPEAACLRSAQLGKGLIQVSRGCPHKLAEAGGHRQAGGTPSSCLRQRGPGQQCRSWAAGERLPPARWCQSDTSRRHKSSPEMGLWGRRDLTTLRPPSRAHLEKSWVQLGKARSKKPFLELAHQVLTCLAPSPAAQSHAAPMNAVFLLPAAQPLAAPQLLRLRRKKSQGLFFCPFPLARLCTVLRAQAGASALGTALQTPVPTGI